MNDENSTMHEEVDDNIGIALTYIYALSYNEDISEGIAVANSISENVTPKELIQGLTSVSAIVLGILAETAQVDVEDIIENIRNTRLIR